MLGLVDETDLLSALLDAKGSVTFDTAVGDVMATALETLSIDAPIQALPALLSVDTSASSSTGPFCRARDSL